MSPMLQHFLPYFAVFVALFHVRVDASFQLRHGKILPSIERELVETMTCPFADQIIRQAFYEMEIDIDAAALTACMDISASASADDVAEDTAELMTDLTEDLLDGLYDENNDLVSGTAFALSDNHVCIENRRRQLQRQGYIWNGGGRCSYCDEDSKS